jgi:Cu(I)/Ag(I) efflux system membrane fusion protein
MTRIFAVGTALALLLASAGAGYHWVVAPSVRPAMAQTQDHDHSAAQKAGGNVLYWKHPDGAAEFSPTPAKTKDGRDYIPVREDEEKAIAPSPSKGKSEAANADRKILYYRNPMGLPDTSPTPKKDWMGMDYIPVYEGEDQGGSSVTVSLDKVQRSGVRTEEARMVKLARPVRAPAIAKPDERTMRIVSLRADAFIEKLYVNETGQHVTAGEPLFRIYSPQMVTAQVNYQVAARDRTPMGTRGAEQQLQNLEVPPAVLDALRSKGEPVMSIDWPSPVSGVVMEKRVIEGQMARMGDVLFRFADLANIWVIADVPEQDLATITIGDPAKVTFKAIPSETFEGRVTFVLHELDAATRTGKVRIEINNTGHRIKHEMYADAEIDAGSGEGERLAVPASAVIDSGSRQVVLVARDEGRFEPRDVKLGVRGDGLVEIREGVSVGEKVVVSANFLIDAESNLKAALSSFSGETPKALDPKTPAKEEQMK